MKLGPNTKPHRDNAGYVCEMKAKLGGHIVIYDRDAPGVGIDADYRWIVMHEPSSLHVAVRSMKDARLTMQGIAKARTIDGAMEFADIIPRPGSIQGEEADDGAQETLRRQKRLAAKPRDGATPIEIMRARSPEQDAQDIARFMADPENGPTPEGKAALHRLMGTAS